MFKEEYPIGLLDSGVGGLTVAREIMKFLPQEKIVYYGDALHLPYGPRILEEVTTFVFKIIDFLINERKVKAIALACNTATSASLAIAKKTYSIPIFGTVAGAASKALKISKNMKVGVIGTEGTIHSKAYQNALHKLDQNLEVFSVACPRFVEIVERGDFYSPVVKEIAHHYLDNLKGAGIDVLILGCTHFPYLSSVIQQVMGDNVSLINPAIEMVLELKTSLSSTMLLKKEKNRGLITQHEFLVSDEDRISESFLKKGRKFLQLPSLKFKECDIFNESLDNSD